MNEIKFIEELEKMNIVLNEHQKEQLQKYYELLIEWNKKINLTRIIKKEDVYLKHFYDSLTITKIIDLNTEKYKLCDVGTGAGFPGVILKIVYPQLEVVLLDSLNKRINFLKDVIEKLQLKNITAVHERMEEYSKEHEEEFDIITSRAVAKTNIITEISVKALKIGGHIILMKGICDDEIKESEKIIEKLKCKIVKREKFELPIEKSNRTLIDILKKEKTPSIYPRSIDKIKKTL